MKDYTLLPGEEIIKTAKGDIWETPSTLEQVSGTFTFTNKRIIFRGYGAIELFRLKFDILYSDIDSIEPYLVVFFRTGIRVWMKNKEKYRLSLNKRQIYMDIINTYIN